MLASGANDMGLDAKWELWYNAKAVYGVNAQVSLPTGGTAFTAGEAQYTGNFNWGYTFDKVWGASGTVGFNSLAVINSSGARERYFAVIPSVTVTAATSPSSQVFAEYAYFSRAGPGIGSKSIINLGYQFDVGPHVQFDVEYGFQPAAVDGQRNHDVGAGISFMH